MPNETVKFENGPKTYRIQFEVVAPPPRPALRPGSPRPLGPQPQFTVASIRVTEVTEGVGDDGPRKVVNFGRGFDTLAQARTGATEYAKRIIREKMTEKPAPVPVPESVPPA